MSEEKIENTKHKCSISVSKVGSRDKECQCSWCLQTKKLVEDELEEVGVALEATGRSAAFIF